MIRESKFILILLCAPLAPAAWGQASPPPAANAAEPVGRLFFTPAQRALLDVARSRRARTTLSTEGTEETAAPLAQTITYGGMVRRDDGKSTVWINGRPVNDNDTAGGASIVGRVRPDGSVSLQVPQSGRSVELKPGQSIELLSGTIEEAYSRRPVQTEPKPAAKPAADGKGVTKPASPEPVKAEREREDQDQQRLQDAIRAVQDAAAAKPGAAPPTESPR